MVLKIIGSVFLIIGALFMFIGNLGVLRMPDVYNKLQAGTKATTMGFLSIAVGVFFYEPSWVGKILVITLFILITNPIGSHALARAAKKSEIKMILADEESTGGEQ